MSCSAMGCSKLLDPSVKLSSGRVHNSFTHSEYSIPFSPSAALDAEEGPVLPACSVAAGSDHSVAEAGGRVEPSARSAGGTTLWHRDSTA